MRSLLIPFCLLIVSIFGIGCQSSSKVSNSVSQPTVKINIGDEPQTLDPRKARDLQGQTLVRMLFEGLTRVGPSEKAELALADRVEVSADLKKWTFHLKESFWSNGDPVTAFDFVYAWKKILTPDFPSSTSFHLYPIKNAKDAKSGKCSLDEVGVLGLDAQTLVIELESPTPYLLELAALPAFFPVHEKSDRANLSWAQNAETFVSNGPFALAAWKHQDHLSLVKNPRYWDASTVQIAVLELQMLRSETELKLFEKEQLDWAGSPLSFMPLDAIKGLRGQGQLQTKEMLGTYFIRVNTQHSPLNHPRLRKALALAINRQAIIDEILQGSQLPATGLVPPVFGLRRAPYFKDFDLENAKSLFSQTLDSFDSSMPEISLMYLSNESRHVLAQALQDQWYRAFGIRVKLEAYEGKIYFDKVARQDYDLALGSWIADFPDPLNFLEIFKYKAGGSNNTLWENERYVELLERSSQVSDPQERQQLLAASEEILMEEMPILPIYYSSMLYLQQPHLQGVVLTAMGQLDFKWASLRDDDQAVAKGEK
jgi:oligopeptide transport system substrate-binding protein